MHLQNIELRNYIVKNFMKEVPKIHHQEPDELKETLIKEPEPEEDESQENTQESNDEEILKQMKQICYLKTCHLLMKKKKLKWKMKKFLSINI